MAIIYRDANSKIFYVKERFTADNKEWIKYTNHIGEEFACLIEAFESRFTPSTVEYPTFPNKGDF